MKHSIWRVQLVSTITAAALVSGCASSLKYRHRKAERVVPKHEEVGLVMADIVDGRDRKASSELPLVYHKPREKSLEQLREATRKHAKRTGLVTDEALFAAAPTTPEQLEQVLAQARSTGAKAVLITRLEGLYAQGRMAGTHALLMIANYIAFVGLVPSLIGFSLPLSGEYASAKIGAFLVEPDSGMVFASFEKSFVHSDTSVTAWGFAPHGELKGVLFGAMQQVFDEAAELLTTADPSVGPRVPVAAVLFGDAEERDHG